MKKLVEIPFNHELIDKEGIVIKDRKGNEYECFVSKKAISAKRPYCIFAFDEDGDCSEHTINGKYDAGQNVSDYDLIMHQEVEVKGPRVIWVNIYPNNAIYAHNSKEDAFNDLMPSGKTVKFIEVIEEGE